MAVAAAVVAAMVAASAGGDRGARGRRGGCAAVTIDCPVAPLGVYLGQVLSACAAGLSAQPGRPGAKCVLRTVAEQMRQPAAGPYRSLVRKVAPLALEAGATL